MRKWAGALLATICACPAWSQPVVVGAYTPLSGDAASFGLSAQRGYELAVAERNAAGGILGRQVSLVVVDDKGDPAEGAIACQRLIKLNKAVAVAGSIMSKVSLAGARVCQQAQVPMISPTSTNPLVTRVGDFIFRACFIDSYQGVLAATLARGKLGAKSAAILYDGGNDYSQGIAEAFTAHFASLGGSIVGSSAHLSYQEDFRLELIDLLSADPELLLVPDYYQDAATIATQARDLGFAGPILGGDGWDSAELFDLGGAAVDNCYFINHAAMDDPRPELAAFVARHLARFGEYPDIIGLLAYDAMAILLDAIARAGSTKGTDIRAALATADFPAVSGRTRFGPDRDPVKPGVAISTTGGGQSFYTTVSE